MKALFNRSWTWLRANPKKSLGFIFMEVVVPGTVSATVTYLILRRVIRRFRSKEGE